MERNAALRRLWLPGIVLIGGIVVASGFNRGVHRAMEFIQTALPSAGASGAG